MDVLNRYLALLFLILVSKNSCAQYQERRDFYFHQMQLKAARPRSNTWSAIEAMGNKTPFVAFSVRKLKDAEINRCMKVRRASDNATKDIGFSELGVVDIEDIMLFLQGSDGYVEVIYSQYNSLFNLRQQKENLQPKIASEGVVFIDKKSGKPYLKFDDDDQMVPSNASRLLERSHVSINLVMRPTSPGNVFVMRLQTGFGYDSEITFNKPASNQIRFDPVSYPFSKFTSDLTLVPDRMNTFVYYKYPDALSHYLNGVRSAKNHFESTYFFTFKYLGGKGSFDFSEMIAWKDYDSNKALTDDDVAALYQDQKAFFDIP